MRRIVALLALGGLLSMGYTYIPPRHPTNQHRPTPKPQPVQVAPAIFRLPRAARAPFREPTPWREPRRTSTFAKLDQGRAYMAAAPGPRVYLAGFNGGQVEVVGPNGKPQVLKPRFGKIVGLACDRAGTLYVADAASNGIVAIGKDSQARPYLGGKAGVPAGFGRASLFVRLAGVGTDARGNVYGLDTNDNAIARRTPAGKLEYVGSAGGWSHTVSFFPTRLAVGPDGICYVWGYLNNDATICRSAGDDLATLEMPDDERRPRTIEEVAPDAAGHLLCRSQGSGIWALEPEGKRNSVFGGRWGVTAIAAGLPGSVFAMAGDGTITRLEL
jgi:hypothetical protein